MKKKLISLVTVFMFIISQTGLAQMIEITTGNGATSTTINTTGNTTDIYTGTSSGKTGFNAFEKFGVDAGQTVNMYLQDAVTPTKTYDNLVNLITGGDPTAINGILNSYKDGKIGGNVFFLNPNGISIGANGIINVGALTLATPTAAHIQSILNNKDGSAFSGDAFSKAVLAGDVPLNSQATISIKGKVNAYYGAAIHADKVDIAGANASIVSLNSINPSDIANFEGAASTDTEIKNVGGRILITAKDINIGEGASIKSAKVGTGKAGDITISAQDKGGNLIATREANVTIGKSTIEGNDVTIEAVASNTYDYDDADIRSELIEDFDFTVDTALRAAGTILEQISEATDGAVEAAFVKSDTKATVTINNDAVIKADNDINIKSLAESQATVKTEAENLALAIGVNLAESKIDIGKATLTAGNDVNIEAKSKLTSEIEAKSKSDNSQFQGAVGVSVVDSDTSVNISKDAKITAGNDINISALTEKNITVTTGVESSTNTKVGLGIGIDYANTDNKLNTQAALKAAKKVVIKSNIYDKPENEGDDIKNQGGEVIIGSTSASPVSVEGNSISVSGQDIKINDGAKLITVAGGSTERGDISIVAEDTDASLVSTKNASVKIGKATIEGKDVTIEAKASNTYDFDKLDERDQIKVGSFTDTLIGVAKEVLDTIADLTGDKIKGVIGKSDTTASITIDNGASVKADNDLGIKAGVESKTEVKVDAKGLGVAVGVNLADASINIGNAKLTAGNNVNIESSSKITSNTEAKSSSTSIGDTVDAGGSVAVSYMNAKNNIILSQDSVINAGNDIKINANTEKSIAMTVETKAGENANAGLAVGVNLSDVKNNVIAKGKLTADNNIEIASKIDSKQNKQTISSSTGNKDEDDGEGEGGGEGGETKKTGKTYDGMSSDKTSENLQEKTDKKSEDANKNSGIENDSNGNKFSIAGSVLYSDHSNSAVAEVSGSSAEIEAGGNIDVKASVIDANIKQFVDAAVGAKASVSGTGAVVISDYTDNVKAFVDGASLDAGKTINVNSSFEMPFDDSWFQVFKDFKDDPDFDSGKAVFEHLTGDKDGQGLTGLKDSVVNSWVRSSAPESSADSKSGNEGGEGGEGGNGGSGGSSFSVDVSGAVNLTDYNSSSEAYIKNAKINQKDALRTGEQKVNVEATSETTSITVGGVFGESYKKPLGQGGSDVGVGGTYNQIRYDTKTNAYIEGSQTELYANDLNIKAEHDQLDVTVGIAGGESSSFGLQGVFNWVKSDSEVNAGIKGDTSGNAKITVEKGSLTDGKVNIEANSTPILVNVGGSLSMSEQAAVGMSAAVTDINRNTNAFITKADVVTDNKTSLYALNDGLIHSYAIAAAMATKKPKKGGDSDSQSTNPNSTNTANKDTGTSGGAGDSGSFGLGISGSAGVSNITGEANAYVEGSNFTGKEDLSIKAREESDIINAAGGVSMAANGGGTGVAVAGAGSISWISNNANAYIKSSTVSNDGDISVVAESDAGIVSVAAGLAGSTASGGATVAGSGTVNITDNETKAYIDDSVIIDKKGVTVSAEDKSKIFSLAGALSLTAGACGFGAGIGVNVLNNSVMAYVLNSDLKLTGNLGANKLSINAKNEADILAIGAAVGVATGNVGIAVTVIVNVIDNETEAYIKGKKNTNGKIEAGNISLASNDSSGIIGVAFSAGVGNTAGIGAGIGVDTITNEASAYIEDAEIETQENVEVEASMTSDIHLAVASIGGGGTAGVAGSVGTNVVNNKATAYIDNSKITANGTAALFADNANNISFYSGAVSIGGTAGVGGNVGIAYIGNTSEAYVKNSNITAKGNKGVGGKEYSYKITKKTNEDDVEEEVIERMISSGSALNGLVVKSNVKDMISTFNAAVSGAGTAAVSGGITGAVARNTSSAKILNSTINSSLTGASASQGVHVLANNEVDVQTISAAMAVSGTAGVSVASDFLTSENNVYAGIEDSTVKARGGVNVKTSNIEKYGAKIASVGIGAGGAGVAGNVVVAVSNSTNEAKISNSTINSGSVSVEAKDKVIVGNDRYLDSVIGIGLGTVAVGMYAGVAGAVFTNVITNKTKANVIDSDITASGKVSVKADSSQKILTNIITGGAGIAGIGITAGVSVVNTETEAIVEESSGKNTKITAGSVDIAAKNELDVSKLYVGMSGGIVGVNASVSVGVYNNNVAAGIGNGVEVGATGDVSVKADNDRKITEDVLLMAAGGGAINGTVSVIVVGGNVDDDSASDEDQRASTYVNNDYKDEIASNSKMSSNSSTKKFAGGGLIDADLINNFDTDTDVVFGTTERKNGTSAFIGQGAVVSAKNVNVEANDTMKVTSNLGSAAVGGSSFGVTVGVNNLTTATNAYIDSLAKINATGNVAVKANADVKESKVNVGMGGLAAGAAVNAGVLVLNVNNYTNAYVGAGAKIQQAKDIYIYSKTSSNITTNILNAALAGFHSVGAVVSVVNKGGTTNAYLGDDVSVGNISKADNLTIEAGTDNKVSAKVYSANAGAGVAANVNVFTTNIRDNLNAYTGARNEIKLNKALSVLTKGKSAGTASFVAVAVSGIAALSVSVADLDIIVNNNAYLKENNKITAGDINVLASQTATNTTDVVGAAGSLLAGVTGIVINNNVRGSVTGEVKSGSTLTADNSVSVGSVSNVTQKAKATTVSAGYVAVGVTSVKNISALNTLVKLQDKLTINADTFTAKSDATAVMESDAQAGQAGMVAVGGAKVETKNNATSSVTIGNSTAENNKNRINVNNFKAYANNSSTQNSYLYSVSVGLLAGFVFKAENTSVLNTSVNIGGRTDINAVNVDIASANEFIKKNSKLNIDTMTGSLFGLYFAESITNATNNSSVNFGQFTNIETSKDGNKESEFTVDAYNKVKAEDEAFLAAVSGANGSNIESKIYTKNNAVINFDGNVKTAKNINASVRADSDNRVQTSITTVAGAAITKGESISDSEINNTINVSGDMYSAGGVNFNFSQSNNGREADYTSVAVTDIYNIALIPIDAGSKANRILNVNDVLNVKAGGVVKSGASVNSVSSEGIYSGRGVLSVKTTYGEVGTETKQRVREINRDSKAIVDGEIWAGINNNININITETDLGGGNVKFNVDIDNTDAEISYEIDKMNLVNSLITQKKYLTERLLEYAESDEIAAGLRMEIEIINNELVALGLRVSEERADGGGYTYTDITASNVDYMEFDDISAGMGDINFEMKNLSGRGKLSAASSSAINIDSNSRLFLMFNDITINDDATGAIKVNNVVVKNMDAVKDVNEDKDLTVSFSKFDTNQSDYADNPKVTIKSYQAGVANNSMAPNVELLGDIENKNGTITVDAAGSVYSRGNINAGTLEVSAGRDFVQSFSNDALFYHLGGNPQTQWRITADQYKNFYSNIGGEGAGKVQIGSWSTSNNLADESSISKITANNVYISGRYLNLNGVIQAGHKDWGLYISDNNLSLSWMDDSTSVTGNIAQALAYKNANPFASDWFELSSAHVAGGLKAYYNVKTGVIEVRDVKVEGGNVYLYGHIMNTSAAGNGKISALDGYGKIEINNQSDYALYLKNIDSSSRINGNIKIVDTGIKGSDGKAKETVFTTASGGNVKITEVLNGRTTTRTVSAGSADAAYKPASGQKYNWTSGTKDNYKERWWSEKNSFWGMDWLVPDKNDYDVTFTNREVAPLLNSEYLQTGVNNSSIYEYFYQYVNTEKNKIFEDGGTYKTGWWIFSTKTYWHEIIYKVGVTHFHRNRINASYPVKIEFFGYSDPQNILINSKSDIYALGTINSGSLASVYMSGSNSIFNAGKANVSGKDITLSAQKGIGATKSVGISLKGGNLTAATTAGDIDLTAKNNTGSLNIVKVETSNGNVKIVSESSIAGANGNAYVKGSEVDMESTLGSIKGNGNGDLEIRANIINASAQGDIFLIKKETGNLGVNSINAGGGDVRLTVNKGNIYDANGEEELDTRTDAELAEAWNKLDLISGYSYEYKEYVLDENNEKIWVWTDEENGIGDYLYETKTTENYNWTTDQLKYALSFRAEGEEVGGGDSAEPANIKGRNITVNAVSGNIGTNETPLTFNTKDFASFDDATKNMIASAAPENIDVSKSGDDTFVTIFRYDDLDIETASGGTVDVSASGYVYLGSAGTLNIKRILAGNNITLIAGGGIYNGASGVSDITVKGTNLVIEAGNGSIGNASKALKLELSGNIVGRASESMYITSDKNLTLDYLNANGNIYLTSVQNILAADSASNTFNVNANGIFVNAKNIGTQANNINVVLNKHQNFADEDNMIELNASDSFYVNNTSSLADSSLYIGSMKAANNAVINSVNGSIYNKNANSAVSAKNININSTGGAVGKIDDKIKVSGEMVTASAAKDINIISSEDENNFGRIASASGSVNIVADNGNINISDAVTAAKYIDILSYGDVITTADGAKLASAQDYVNIDAGGTIDLNGDVKAKKSVTIDANKDINVKSVVSEENEITMTAAGGIYADGYMEAKKDIIIESGKDYTSSANASSVSKEGNYDLTAGGKTTLNASVQAAKDIGILSTGDIITAAAARLESVNENINITGKGNGVLGGTIKAKKDINIDIAKDLTIEFTSGLESAGANIDVKSAGKTNLEADVQAAKNIGFYSGSDFTSGLNTVITSLDESISFYIGGRADLGGIVRAKKNIDIDIPNSELVVKNIVSALDGTLRVDAYGNITSDRTYSAAAGLYTNNIDLTSRVGGIGTQNNRLQIGNENGDRIRARALAAKSIYVDAIDAIFQIVQFRSGENVELFSEETIEVEALPNNEANVIAQNITLHSNRGSIGTQALRIIVETIIPEGKVNLDAASGIYLDQFVNIFHSDYVINRLGGKVLLTLPQSHAKIALFKAGGATEVNVQFLDNRYVKDINITKNDVKRLVVHPDSVLYPHQSNIDNRLDMFSTMEENITISANFFTERE